MLKLLLFLATTCILACGSASTGGPKVTNPPLGAKERKTPQPPASGKPPMEVDGLTLKLNAFGFSLTVPNAEWQGDVSSVQGEAQIMLKHANPAAMALLSTVTMPNGSSKALVEGMRNVFLSDKTNVATPVADLGGGRWGFIIETSAADGTTNKGRFTSQPIVGMKDRYFQSLLATDKGDYDTLVGQIDSMLDSVKPLPK